MRLLQWAASHWKRRKARHQDEEEAKAVTATEDIKKLRKALEEFFEHVGEKTDVGVSPIKMGEAHYYYAYASVSSPYIVESLLERLDIAERKAACHDHRVVYPNGIHRGYCTRCGWNRTWNDQSKRKKA